MMRIVVVCTGNICRSPMGEIVLRERARERGMHDLRITSAGVSAEETGKSIDPRAVDALHGRGYEVPEHRAHRVTDDELGADLLVAMTESHVAQLHRRGADPRRVRLWMDFVAGVNRRDVADPWYGVRDDFEETLDLIEAGADNVLDELAASKG